MKRKPRDAGCVDLKCENRKSTTFFSTGTQHGGYCHYSFLHICFQLFFSILVNMDDRMVEQFVDEDDFIIKIDFDNQLGHFELTLFY